jgi:hypothetical protein
VYLCTGFLTVEVLLSPKFQDQAVGLLVPLSVNVTVIGAFPDVVDAVKEANGTEATGTFGILIVTVFVAVALPAAFFTVKLTVYFPAFVNVWETLCVIAVVPSPKFQIHDVGELVLVSVNEIALIVVPVVVDALKEAKEFLVC